MSAVNDAKGLTLKALGGAVGLMIALGILLFLPPWSFDYWQAWVFLSVFGVCVATVTIYFLRNDPKLIASRVNAGPTAEKERTQKVIQAFANLFFIALLLVPALDHLFLWSNMPTFLVILGNIFVALGFLIVFFVFKENSYTSAIIQVQKEQKVISTGPYRMVRHPMYVGGLLLVLFTPIALGSYWGLLTVLPMFIVIILRLLDEEKFLAKNLPGYKEYCQKVRYRLAPFVW